MLDELGAYSDWTLARDALLVFGVVGRVRIAWMFTVPHLVAVRRPQPRAGPRSTRGRTGSLLGWCGMRGALSLAAALSIPVDGRPPRRDPLPHLHDDPRHARRPRHPAAVAARAARLRPARGDAARRSRRPQALVETALRRLDELEAAGSAGDGRFQAVRQLYERRWIGSATGTAAADVALDDYHRLRRELLDVERERAPPPRAGGADRLHAATQDRAPARPRGVRAADGRLVRIWHGVGLARVGHGVRHARVGRRRIRRGRWVSAVRMGRWFPAGPAVNLRRARRRGSRPRAAARSGSRSRTRAAPRRSSARRS